ncbi:hypothetical protein C8R44DRAFT_864464 [Mycena epipterygia]|nr:hypothetical protein C8R44DRAFT_864464 [Mycena epipterygia]
MAAESAEQVVQIFYGLKYFSAVSFIAVVFDHLITIDDEVNTIWNNPNVRLHSKAAFIVNRYLTEGVMAYVVYIFSGTGTTLDTTVYQNVSNSVPLIMYIRCWRFIWIYGITCIVAGAISHFVILIRVYSLWDHRASVARILTAAFTVCISTTTILGVFAAIQIEPDLSYFEPLQTCVFGSKPKVITAMLGVLSFFDFFIVLLIIFNAIDRPRLTHIEIVSALQKDGLGLFLTIFALRFADFVVSIFQTPTEVFVAITTVWGFATIINARLHMRLKGLSLSRSRRALVMFEEM